ncbi:MAG: peptidase C15 [Scytolyngbya sp. HA4215-MV1]|jgi:pyroglutamyl-peptidase|nr:peptidase C15 [Scytolyngbya sp. HA4215-MV1]
MASKLLITSFNTWEAHQPSNAADDLLAEVLRRNGFHDRIHLLRQLPVDFQLAPAAVLAQIAALQPDAVVCCGMAETRTWLTVETNGKHQQETCFTPFLVPDLVKDLPCTRISHDAGNFVCNHLYYSLLKQFQPSAFSLPCLFVHVPRLHEGNLQPILSDFVTLLQRIESQIELQI